jgi:putative tryptophan/tyrosine transport system substrate-binding protein
MVHATRRQFITLLGGAATWPVAARAQQRERMRRVGVLMPLAADDPESQARTTAFVQELAQVGWIAGRNVQIDNRWSAADSERTRRYVAELVALAPDVIVTSSTVSVAALIEATRTVPIVFAGIPDPVGAGFINNLSRPGGNVTGFLLYEYGLSAKWLEMLKQIAPQTTRVAVIRESTAIATGAGQFAAIQTAAPSVGVEVSPINVRAAGEIEHGVTAFARSPNGGLIVTGGPLMVAHRDLMVALAARHRLPAVYTVRFFVTGGGLISYGPDRVDQWRRAAGYVDRILKGEKPGDLPVQAPTKYELVINLKTAKALGLEIPPPLLARADEVIE